jgi:soluble cytochrome b562
MGTATTGDVSEGMTNLGNDQRAIKAIKDIAEESKKEAKELGRELREEMATLAKQLAEQNSAQEKARLEETQRSNKTLEDLRNMMMIMMSSASAKTNV